jgi:hypothetical protein
MKEIDFVDELKEAVLNLEKIGMEIIIKPYRKNVEITFKIMTNKHDESIDLNEILLADKQIQKEFHNNLNLWYITRFPDSEEIELSYFINEYINPNMEDN